MLLCYDTVQLGRLVPTFLRNMLPPSSGYKKLETAYFCESLALCSLTTLPGIVTQKSTIWINLTQNIAK